MLGPLPLNEEMVIDATAPSTRLRLVQCKLSHIKGGRSAVCVEFKSPSEGPSIASELEDTASPAGDLRLAALATLAALHKATGGAFSAELIGAKAVRAFDSTIVVVAMMARVDGQTRRLIGAAMGDNDQITAVALATLQAVNRVVSPLLLRAEDAAS